MPVGDWQLQWISNSAARAEVPPANRSNSVGARMSRLRTARNRKS